MQCLRKNEIDNTDESGQNQHGHQNNSRRLDKFFAGRPRDFVHLAPNFGDKLFGLVKHLNGHSTSFVYFITGAAGIEPAVPVLETGGLPLTDAPKTDKIKLYKNRKNHLRGISFLFRF